MGSLRTGNKSELMSGVENLVPVKEDLSTSRVQVNILDGAAIINMLRPGTAKTFQCSGGKTRFRLGSLRRRQLESRHSQQERKGS